MKTRTRPARPNNDGLVALHGEISSPALRRCADKLQLRGRHHGLPRGYTFMKRRVAVNIINTLKTYLQTLDTSCIDFGIIKEAPTLNNINSHCGTHGFHIFALFLVELRSGTENSTTKSSQNDIWFNTQSMQTRSNATSKNNLRFA